MYECFHCRMRAVIWDCDYSFEDYGDFDGDGLYQVCHCTNCGAEITYRVPFKNEEDENNEE